jgi:hypothetical protein
MTKAEAETQTLQARDEAAENGAKETPRRSFLDAQVYIRSLEIAFKELD